MPELIAGQKPKAGSELLNPCDGDLLQSALTSQGFNFMVIAMRKLVCGVGLNDADYEVARIFNGKYSVCPFYARWSYMIRRCYCSKFHKKQPTYAGCTVCDEWLTFSNFKAWMEKQDWQGKELDKDLLFVGNNIYSEKTCVFIGRSLNNFVTDRGSKRGLWPIGVVFNKSVGKLQSRCRNPFSDKTDHLGTFTCPHEAHQAWRKRKHEIACQLADLQDDPRIANALRTRYITTIDIDRLDDEPASTAP